MVELGNYDSFYIEGRTFSAEEVLALTVRTRYVASIRFESQIILKLLPRTHEI